MNPFQRFLKRAFDISISFLGILFLLLPFLIIGLLAKITSRGPILFRQIRIGRHGMPFMVIKFRTMYLGSEKHGFITAASDSRITPLGRFLRNYKLDEFPQLWNVLIGKMSFVGPRPDVPGYADKLIGDERKILELRPGITSPASIYFRNEEELLASVPDPRKYNDQIIWPKKVALNREYMENWGFFKDLGYIFSTLFPWLWNRKETGK